MDLSIQQNVQRALNNEYRVRVAKINEHLQSSTNEDRFVEATVQLVWPYSSSTSQLSLLLVEKDVSIRETTAQLRVTFHSTCAREVAQLRIGIGDTLSLLLRHAAKEDEEEQLSTPGKKPGFDLHFRTGVGLQAYSIDGSIKTLDYVAPAPFKVVDSTSSTLGTSLRNGSIDISKSRQIATSTPFLKKPTRLSSNSFPGSLVDPFTEEDGSVQGRGRKRTKFARRSNQWRLAGASDEETEPVSETQIIQDITTSASSEQLTKAIVTIDLTETSLGNDEVDTLARSISSSPIQVIDDTFEKHERIVDEDVADTKLIPSAAPPVIEVLDIEDSSPTPSHVSTSPQPQIPVERVSPEIVTAALISAPALMAPTSPDLVIAPPFASNIGDPFLEASLASESIANIYNSDQIMQNAFHTENNQPYDVPPTQAGEILLNSAAPEIVRATIETSGLSNSLIQGASDVAEVDLDKLQEEIDMSNANFLADMPLQAIEDGDLYSAPQDAEIGMDLEQIRQIEDKISTSNSEIPYELQQTQSSELEKSTKPLLTDKNAAPLVPDALDLNQTSSNPPFEKLVVAQNQFQPYPYHVESSVTSKEQTVLESERESKYMDFRQSEASQPRFLDGSTSEHDASHLSWNNLEEIESPLTQATRPTLSITGARESPNDDHRSLKTNRDKLPSPDIHESSLAATSPIQNDVEASFERDGVTIDTESSHNKLDQRTSFSAMMMMTPDATQVSRPFAEDSPTRAHHTDGHFPPTPMASQAELSQIKTREDMPNSSPGIHELDTVRDDRNDSRQQLVKRPIEQIESPYFTPNKPSMGSTSEAKLVVSTNQYSSNVPGRPQELNSDVRLTEHATFPDLNPASKVVDTKDIQNVASAGGISTPLGYYTFLQRLSEHYDQLVDVIAICVDAPTVPERAKTGPKDYFTTLHLTDSSIHETSISMTVQIFRPRKNALPTIKKGDVLFLRRFKVQTRKRQPMLLSTEESAWAVYALDQASITDDGDEVDLAAPPTVSGPPIEHGKSERVIAGDLMKWWLAVGEDFDESRKPVQDAGANSKNVQRFKKPAPAPLELRRSPRRTRKNTNSDADPSPTSPTFEPGSPDVSNRTPHSPLSQASPRSTNFYQDNSNPTSPSKSKADAAASLPTSPSTRSKTKAQQLSNLTSPTFHVDDSTQNGRDASNQNFSSSNSVVSGITEISGSSRRRRYERRSTSLVHQLRDGTEWVDVEQEEIYSVTESEDDADDGESDSEIEDGNISQSNVDAMITDLVDQDSLRVHQRSTIEGNEDASNENVNTTVDLDVPLDQSTSVALDMSPTRRGRGRPRKEEVEAPSQDLKTSGTADPTLDEAASRRSGRVTRSQAGK